MNTHAVSQKRLLWVFLFLVMLLSVYLNRSYAYVYRFMEDQNLTAALMYVPPSVHMSGSATSTRSIATRVVAMGDSLTAGVGVTTQEKSYPFVFATTITQEQKRDVYLTNLAVPGAESGDVLRTQVDAAIALQPDIITLCIGANDMHNFVNQKEFRVNLESIVDRLSSETDAKIVLMTVPFVGTDDLMRFPFQPLFRYRTEQYNETIRAVATAKQVQIVDIYNETIDPFYTDKAMYSSDLFHPSETGYVLIANILYAGLYR